MFKLTHVSAALLVIALMVSSSQAAIHVYDFTDTSKYFSSNTDLGEVWDANDPVGPTSDLGLAMVVRGYDDNPFNPNGSPEADANHLIFNGSGNGLGIEAPLPLSGPNRIGGDERIQFDISPAVGALIETVILDFAGTGSFDIGVDQGGGFSTFATVSSSDLNPDGSYTVSGSPLGSKFEFYNITDDASFRVLGVTFNVVPEATSILVWASLLSVGLIKRRR